MIEKHIPVLSSRKFVEQGTRELMMPGPAFPIVVVVADEISTVSEILRGLSPSLGMAYVVMECVPGEVSPGGGDEPRHLQELQAATAMRVQEVREGMQVEKDHVYWIGSGGNNIEVADGHWHFVSRAIGSGGSRELDVFLSNLSSVYTDRMVVVASFAMIRALVMGLRVVQMEGGLSVLIGDERDGSEPGSYLRDCVDVTLAADAVAARLSVLAGMLAGTGLRALKAGIDYDLLSKVYFILSERKGADLSFLKEDDMARHVFRRMVLTDTRSREEYFEALTGDTGEADLLFEELQCCSTGFSADPGLVMQLVDRVLPAVLEKRSDERPLRIWMPGCMCGEEAYAVAFCVAEYLKESGHARPVQLFATSLNRKAILRARTGVYTEAEMRVVAAGRRKKFFAEKDGVHHIVKAVKDMCVFAMHNLLKDPPFSHIDVIIVRNMLCGLDRAGQKRVVESLHYALNKGGWLFAGGHRAGGVSDYLFRQVSYEPKVYRRVEGPAGFTHASLAMHDSQGTDEAKKVLMSGYVPASILVDESYRVVHFYGSVDPYLRPWEDRPSLHLLKIVRDELVFDLGEMLRMVAKEEKPLKREGIVLREGEKPIGIDVVPLSSPNRKWRLVVIHPMPLKEGKDMQSKAIKDSRDRRIDALKRELQETREQLIMAYEQSVRTQEALYSANEEMMASNEELQSINEELQSINQALEKAKGDLQSYNTELDSVNRDLHQRNKELELSVDQAYAVIAAIRQPLMVLREDLRIRMVNPYFCKVFGLNPDELKGEYLYTIARGFWDIDELRERLQRMVANRLPTLELELKHVFPRVGERVFAFTATRILEEGKASGILLAMEDVTERRMVERIKDEFIGIASHELKTPATSIMAYSQLLYEELKGASDQRAAMLVNRLNAQVGRLARLTKDLLDVTRISQGQILLKKQFFNLNDLIGEMVDEMQVTTPVHIIIGELASVPTIWGDEERIGQVLRNLLSNAIKYSPAAKEVRVYTKATKKNVSLSVEDFGIGMSTETLQRVFDRFYRSDDPSVNRHPGLGLGLYIASEIVRRHGGTITVKSEKGKGSVFTVILPFGSQE